MFYSYFTTSATNVNTERSPEWKESYNVEAINIAPDLHLWHSVWVNKRARDIIYTRIVGNKKCIHSLNLTKCTSKYIPHIELHIIILCQLFTLYVLWFPFQLEIDIWPHTRELCITMLKSQIECCSNFVYIFNNIIYRVPVN